MTASRASVLAFFALAGCDAVAGLNEFQPAAAGGGGALANGGAPAAGAPEGGAPEAGAPPIGGEGGGVSNCATDLLIAEIRTYGVGAGDDDFVEILNPTDMTLSLESVSVWAYKPPSEATERWRGKADDLLSPGGRFVLGGLGLMELEPDAELGVGESIGDSHIVLLRRGPSASPSTIDHVCVCAGDCNQDIWGGCPGVLPNPAYFDAMIHAIPDSLSRLPDCEDSDAVTDFQPGAPTPGEANDP